MDWLNYHHLLYFWTVAREGSITKASEVLRLAPSTVSVQIKMLEEAIGVDLFERRGRRLIMTDAGRIAFSYAGEIFQLGQELLNTFKSQPVGRPLRLVVGVADVLWKEIAHQLVRPATTLETPVHLVCVEGSVDELLAEMAIHNIDVVLADSPLGPSVGVKAFNHLLGKSGVGFFGSEELVEQYGADFPASLNGAPMLLPTMRTSLRRHLDQWFQTNNIRPHIVAEFDDSAMMTKFGSAGEGLFPAPTVVALDLADSHNVQLVGEADKVQQRFYAISPERRIKLPAVQAICEAARQSVFS